MLRRPRLHETSISMRSLIILIIFSLAPFLYALEKDPGYEKLLPEEQDLLEKEIFENPPPSLCENTAIYARAPIRNGSYKLPQNADFLLLDKRRRLLHLFAANTIIATYRVGLGAHPIGHKEREGDQKTPEGVYFFDLKNYRSDYHLGLHLNYPNLADRIRAAEKGIRDPGKDIMIHGLPNNWFKRKFINHPSDWTRGCAAVTNSEIQNIFAAVSLGTLIEICP